MFKTFTFSILLLLASSAHSAVSVGDANDTNCDFQDLQAAIDSGDKDIRVTTQNVLTGHFTLANSNNNLVIRGGFTDCDEANQNNNDETSKTIIQKTTPNTPIFSISQVPNVELRQLHIQQSDGASAILANTVTESLRLNQLELSGNAASHGAALNIQGSSIVEIHNSHIHNNSSTNQGGAILCDRSTLTISQNNLINNNSSISSSNLSGHGGAIYANRCELNISAGHSDGQSAGFISNQASDEGGAIYAKSSTMQFDGQKLNELEHPVLFKNNLSDSDDNGSGGGGVIYMAGGEALFKGIWMNGNKSSESGVGQFNRGAAIYADRTAKVTVTRDETQPCWREDSCNLIENSNHVVFYVKRPGTEFTMTHSEVRDNNAAFTGIIWARNQCCLDNGEGPFVTLENNLFHHNTSANANLLKTDSSGNGCCQIHLDIQHNTITDNVFAGEVFNINAQVTLNLHNNIIHNTNPNTFPINVLDDPTVNTTIGCNLVDTDTSIPANATQTLVADPQFVNATELDYHISPTSPAIDVCAQAPKSLTLSDLDLQSRGRDDEAVANAQGAFDIGADEYYQPDLIYKSGFEATQ